MSTTISIPTTVVTNGSNGAMVDFSTSYSGGNGTPTISGGSNNGNQSWGAATGNSSGNGFFYFDSPGTYTVSITSGNSTATATVTVIAASSNVNSSSCGSNESCGHCGSNCGNCGSNCGYHANSAPTASYTLSKTTAYEDEVIYITDKSSDPNSDQISYAWTVTPDQDYIKQSTSKATYGNTNTDIWTSIKFSKAGTYTISLVITDQHNAKSTANTQTLTIQDSPPDVKFSVQSPIYRDALIQINDQTTDAHDLFTEVWSIDPITNVVLDGSAKTLKFSALGTYSLKCIATDTRNAVSQNTIDVIVESHVVPPVIVTPVDELVMFSKRPKLKLIVRNVENQYEPITDVEVMFIQQVISGTTTTTIPKTYTGTAYSNNFKPYLPYYNASTKVVFECPEDLIYGAATVKVRVYNGIKWSDWCSPIKLNLVAPPALPIGEIEAGDIEQLRNIITKEYLTHSYDGVWLGTNLTPPIMPLNDPFGPAYLKYDPSNPGSNLEYPSGLIWKELSSFNSGVSKDYIQELRSTINTVANVFNNWVGDPIYDKTLIWAPIDPTPELECVAEVIDNLDEV